MPPGERINIPKWSAPLIAEIELRKNAVDQLLPKLAEARRRYATSRADADWTHLEAIQEEASAAQARFSEGVRALEKASGIPPEILDRLSSGPDPSQGPDQVPRANLRQEHVASTASLDDFLPNALEAIRRILPPGWEDAEPREPNRLTSLRSRHGFLSLTKGLRPESEAPSTHRFRQYLHVSQDYQVGNLTYDHFSGATVVPSLVQLGVQLDNLKQVGGDVHERLERLWKGSSSDVDATLLELFTAAGCARAGRNVEFIPATSARSPDIRCHDPYPLVIECKRQRALSDYELAAMKSLQHSSASDSYLGRSEP